MPIFDRGALERLFNAGEWEWLACGERTNHRYSKPKVAWEIVLRVK